MMEDGITLSEKDYLRLKNLIERADSSLTERLDFELSLARIISDHQVPPELVTMNSTLSYENLTDGEIKTISLVYPQDANPSKNKISVLSPEGTALLGLSLRQEINWLFPDGKTRRLKVREILFQPEKEKLWHL